MTEETKTLGIAWQSQERVPGLISGEDALMIYNSLPDQARVGLRYDEETRTMVGSTPIAAANLDSLAQKYGARTPNLRDLSRPEIMRIAQGEYYIDSRNLVARSRTDSAWGKNNSLLKTIYELAEQKLGRITGSFMIDGFNFVPNSEDTGGYGLSLVAKPDFDVVQDERLDGEHNGKRFSEVDELGLPKFYSNGSRMWYAKSEGLSRLYLDWDLGLNSSSNSLAYSNDYGRVVFLK
ncbi:MAG: hypothetical protein NTW17_01375 [Candidatus Pacearchaeota archaeon]|nr:hypothetical protein [Candidatus Pacearchaeota archaeon]